MKQDLELLLKRIAFKADYTIFWKRFNYSDFSSIKLLIQFTEPIILKKRFFGIHSN